MKLEVTIDPPVKGMRLGQRFELARVDSDGFVLKPLEFVGIYEYGRVRIDTLRMVALEADEVVHLTKTEWVFMETLLASFPRAASWQELAEARYGDADGFTSQNVRVYISRLRTSFKASFIESVQGYGYRLLSADEPEATLHATGRKRVQR